MHVSMQDKVIPFRTYNKSKTPLLAQGLDDKIEYNGKKEYMWLILTILLGSIANPKKIGIKVWLLLY